MGHKAIARSLGAAASTVRLTLARAAAASLSWPLPDDLSDTVIEERLYGRAGTKQGQRRHAEPDWALIHRELRRKHVTLSILWEEYIAQHPAGYLLAAKAREQDRRCRYAVMAVDMTLVLRTSLDNAARCPHLHSHNPQQDF
jgi:transposase